ncbi:MAG: NUDIX domain-containing protein [Candidatus Absconditabacterales bacterium]|jgi:ADP-ribose pyrophosphatase YjhB (NUDIX family)
MKNKHPELVIGAFIINNKNELFLRTTPSQNDKYTCVNGKIAWGETIEKTLKNQVKEKTNLEIESYELIGLTNGLNIISNSNPEPINMIFADYIVRINNLDKFKSDEKRKYKWLLPKEWLKMEKDKFGPYIREVILKISL